MKRIGVAAISMTMFSSCVLNVSDSDRLDRKDGKVLDTPKNRDHYLATFDRTIDLENKGGSPPPAEKNWDSFWARRFNALQGGQRENPQFYINYIKQRRKALGLPRGYCQRASAADSSSQALRIASTTTVNGRPASDGVAPLPTAKRLGSRPSAFHLDLEPLQVSAGMGRGLLQARANLRIRIDHHVGEKVSGAI